MKLVQSVEHHIWAVIGFSFYYLVIEHFLQLFQVLFWPALFVCVFGSIFPDLDLGFGAKYHRSPVTHSALVPTLFFIFYILIVPDPTTYRFLAVFFLGYASHLFLDIFPSNASIFKRAAGIFEEYTPGDIRGVPEKYEKPLLIWSGAMCLVWAGIFLVMAEGIIPWAGIIVLPW